MKRFIGREKELRILRSSIATHSNGIMIYGPRRVGKSSLIKEAIKNEAGIAYIYYECIKGTFEYNTELFAKEAAASTGISYLAGLQDLFMIFDALKKEGSSRKVEG